MPKRKANKTTAAEQAAPAAEAPPTVDSVTAKDSANSVTPQAANKAASDIATPTEMGARVAPAVKPPSKTRLLVELLRRPGRASIEAMMQATGWQAHSVRGALSGAVKKGLGLPVFSQKTETGRVYSLPAAKADGDAA